MNQAASGRIRPHLTPLECGIIFGGIPAGAISRKGGLIWGIPVEWSIDEEAVAWLTYVSDDGVAVDISYTFPADEFDDGRDLAHYSFGTFLVY